MAQQLTNHAFGVPAGCHGWGPSVRTPASATFLRPTQSTCFPTPVHNAAPSRNPIPHEMLMIGTPYGLGAKHEASSSRPAARSTPTAHSPLLNTR